MNKKISMILWILLLVVLIAAAPLAVNRLKVNVKNPADSVDSTQKIETDDELTEEGEIKKNAKGMPLLPDFKLFDNDGESFVLSDYLGKIVIMNFWASWCGPCAAEMPDLNKFYLDNVDSDDIVFVTINLTDGQRETKDIANSFIEENGYSFPVYFDEEGLAAYIFSITSIPTTIIADREGYLHKYIQGMLNLETLQNYLDEVE